MELTSTQRSALYKRMLKDRGIGPSAASSAARVSPARLILGNGIARYRDTDGRPLGEQRTPDLYAQVKSELKRCPYHDSRNEHALPMNTSALKQMTRSWSEVKSTIGLLSAEYARREGRTRLDFFDLWRIAQLGLALPVFLASRRVEPVADGAMPVLIAAVYKVLLGVTSSVGTRAISAGLIRRLPGARWLVPVSWRLPTADTLYASINKGKELIGLVEVCAGPPGLILSVLEVLLAPPPATEPSPLAEIIPSFDDYYRFGIETTELMLAHTSFMLGARHSGISRRAPRGPQRLHLAQVEHELRQRQTGQVADVSRSLDGLAKPLVNLVLKEVRARARAHLPALGSQWADYPAFEDAHLDAYSTSDRALCAVLGVAAPNPITAEDAAALCGATLRQPLSKFSARAT